MYSILHIKGCCSAYNLILNKLKKNKNEIINMNFYKSVGNPTSLVI